MLLWGEFTWVSLLCEEVPTCRWWNQRELSSMTKPHAPRFLDETLSRLHLLLISTQKTSGRNCTTSEGQLESEWRIQNRISNSENLNKTRDCQSQYPRGRKIASPGFLLKAVLQNGTWKVIDIGLNENFMEQLWRIFYLCYTGSSETFIINRSKFSFSITTLVCSQLDRSLIWITIFCNIPSVSLTRWNLKFDIKWNAQ